jgi:hypothetical protein
MAKLKKLTFAHQFLAIENQRLRIANKILNDNPNIFCNFDVFKGVRENLLEKHSEFLQKLEEDFGSESSSDNYQELEQSIPQMTEFETVLPSMATLTQNSKNIIMDNTDDCDFEIVDPIKTIKVDLPRSYDPEKFSFKGTFPGIFLKVSIVPDTSHELDYLIKTLLPFAEITVFGTHKKSLSSRNAYKFRIQCENYYTTKEFNQIYKTPLMFVNNEYVIYELCIRSKLS